MARRISDVGPSATVRIADLAATLRRAGVDVIDLSAGRAAESTPLYVREVAMRAIATGDTHQTPARGTPEYRAACAAKLARENAIVADPEREVIATLGCKHGLALALYAVLDPGDEVLVEDPGFVSYAPEIRLAGAVPVPVPLRADAHGRWTRDDLERAVTPRTRALLFCSPHNPTGVVHTGADLDVIAGFARDHDLWVISDEIYERVAWNGRRHISIAARPGMADRTISLFGLTKSFSMGGWRIGFARAPAEAVQAMTSVQQHLVTCPGSFVQAGAAAALATAPRPEVLEMWREWEARCRFLAGALDRVPGIRCTAPEGAFYAWADIRGTGEDSVSLAERLLRDLHVAVVPGSAFGPTGEGFLRITCVRSREDIEQAAARITEALA